VTAQLRLALLVLAFAYSIVVLPAQALAARAKAHMAAKPLRESLLTTANFFLRAQKAAKAERAARAAQRERVERAKTIGIRAVSFAKQLIGVPYSWGGTSPATGFDCSGFVRFVYDHFGIDLPHSSYAQFDYGRRVTRGGLKPGDLVFFDGEGHVGMYVGDGRFIHAPHTGTRVEIDSLSGWYAGRYDGARRLTPA